MNIPRYWAKAERGVSVGGQRYRFVAWQGSDESPEHARLLAERALAERVARKERGERLGQYPKGGAPLREEILEELTDARGERVAVITRNAAGCLVLNTARVMFIDLDFAQAASWGRAGCWAFVRSLFSRPRPARQSPEEGALERVRAWHAEHPGWAVRVYRTRLGLRLLVTHALFDPASPEALAAMRKLGADRRYELLCRSQTCFRARLTPKPWRIGLKRPPVRYPWESPSQERAQRQWERAYEAKIGGYDVCRLLTTLGSAAPHPEAEQIVRLHDGYVLSSLGRPLA